MLSPREFSTRTRTELLKKKMSLRRHAWETKKESRRGWQSWVEIYVDDAWRPWHWGVKIGDCAKLPSAATSMSDWWMLVALVSIALLLFIGFVMFTGILGGYITFL